MLLAMVVPLSGFAPSSSTQYVGLGVGRDHVGSNSLLVLVLCRSTPSANSHTCTGNGQGTLSGKHFVVSDFTTDLNPDALVCNVHRCDGGTLEASGYGWLGFDQIAFDFCGYDAPDPSSAAAMQLIVHTGPAAAITHQAVGASVLFGPGCTSAPATGAISPSVTSAVYTFSCDVECFDLIRTKR
jgi:hypothetical protein